jgi:hypothetical protein
MEDHGIGMTEALLGLDGFRVLEVAEGDGELIVRVESIAEVMVWRLWSEGRVSGPGGAGVSGSAVFRSSGAAGVAETEVAMPPGGMPVRDVDRDLGACLSKDGVDPPRRVGGCAARWGPTPDRSPSWLASSGRVWWTAMNAVSEHGAPLVEDPDRVGIVATLGLDETSFLKANRRQPTRYVTGFVDLDRRRMIDLVEGNDAKGVKAWLASRDPQWRRTIETVAIDLAESYRAGLSPLLDHATRVADPFHVVRVANRCLDQVRRRVQNETLEHRGRKDDPLYRIRKLLLKGVRAARRTRFGPDAARTPGR